MRKVMFKTANLDSTTSTIGLLAVYLVSVVVCSYEGEWKGSEFMLSERQCVHMCMSHSVCVCVCVCVCVYSHADSCMSVLVFVCLARLDQLTGLISRDLWALTGCRLVSTATTKGWRRFTYPDGAIHPRAQYHFAHRGGPTSGRREVPMWGREWERGQHTIGVARSLWWVHEEICCKVKLHFAFKVGVGCLFLVKNPIIIF